MSSVWILVKSFDNFPYSIPLEKLAAHALHRCTVCWVKNWLGDRAQRDMVNGVQPSWQPLSLPGLSLGANLNIFISDMDEGSECTFSMFTGTTGRESY